MCSTVWQWLLPIQSWDPFLLPLKLDWLAVSYIDDGKWQRWCCKTFQVWTLAIFSIYLHSWQSCLLGRQLLCERASPGDHYAVRKPSIVERERPYEGTLRCQTCKWNLLACSIPVPPPYEPLAEIMTPDNVAQKNFMLESCLISWPTKL